MKIFIYLMLTIASFSLVAKNNQADNTKKILDLMHEREAVMKDVAAYKFKKNISVYSASRENSILQEVKIKNLKKRLRYMTYLQVSMDASKQIESYWIHYWSQKGIKPQPHKNLKQIRNEINRIDKKLAKLYEKSKFSKMDYKHFYKRYERNFNVKGLNKTYKELFMYNLYQVTQQYT